LPSHGPVKPLPHRASRRSQSSGRITSEQRKNHGGKTRCAIRGVPPSKRRPGQVRDRPRPRWFEAIAVNIHSKTARLHVELCGPGAGRHGRGLNRCGQDVMDPRRGVSHSPTYAEVTRSGGPSWMDWRQFDSSPLAAFRATSKKARSSGATNWADELGPPRQPESEVGPHGPAVEPSGAGPRAQRREPKRLRAAVALGRRRLGHRAGGRWPTILPRKTSAMHAELQGALQAGSMSRPAATGTREIVHAVPLARGLRMREIGLRLRHQRRPRYRKIPQSRAPSVSWASATAGARDYWLSSRFLAGLEKTQLFFRGDRALASAGR